ncbi:MccB protein [Paenibacillus pini JCM 16418]|uniref:MccB protein n=1 Tax=Paenibacillus pini JCM 16418 TaxID=1236976 RepID=W7YT44_9BACL|nr:MccB protein [Paenibacillus pini JCM 16418]
MGFFSLLSGDFEQYHQKLQTAHVLLLGAGAIGTHVLWNLAAMGVGKVTVIDFDVIEESNLNRQLMYHPGDIGESKVEVLCERIKQFNPSMELYPIRLKVESPADIERYIDSKSLVIKAIDTPEEATEWANGVCVKHKIPLINGGFLDHIGVVGPIYLPNESLCAACLGFGNARRIYGTGPTFGPLTMMVASTVSMFSFKILVGQTAELRNKLHLFNTKTSQWDILPLRAAERCPVCGHNPHENVVEAPAVNKQRIWGYRGSMAGIFILASLLRYFTGDVYVGMLALLMLLISFLFIDSWFEDQPAELRKEIFIVSSIYCGISLITNLVININAFFTASGRGFDFVFAIIQNFSLTVLEISVAISILFFLSNAVVFVIKYITRKGDMWLS